MAEKITRYKAIKDFFGIPGRPVTLSELKELSSSSRQELAEGAAAELGKELEVKK